jgi:hypothetical protein
LCTGFPLARSARKGSPDGNPIDVAPWNAGNEEAACALRRAARLRALPLREARNRRLKNVELVIEEAAWHGLARRPRRNDHDLVGVRIEWNESGLRSAVKQAGAIWRPRQKLWEMSWEAVRTLGIGHRVVTG